MKSIPLFLAISMAFILAFFGHISVVLYTLSVLIFYFYIPILYSYSRVNVFHGDDFKEVVHLRFYPMEFTIWVVLTSFFSYIIAHLLASLLFDVHHLHQYMFPVMLLYIALIIYRELQGKKLHEQHNQAEQINYEKQGRLISFEILFLFLALFMIQH
jgi:hypothetical protein